MGSLLPAAQFLVIVALVAWTVEDVVRAWRAGGVAADEAALAGLALATLTAVLVPVSAIGGGARPAVVALGAGALGRIAAHPSAFGGAVTSAAGASACAVVVAVGALWLGGLRSARSRPPLVLGCPFAEGTWAVLQGGGPGLNAHRRSRGQQHALDLVRVPRTVGLRTWPPVPRTHAAFPSFGQAVLSPVSGRIVGVEAAVDDESPDRLPPAGNCVAIEPDGHCGWWVLLGHLRMGSVTVRPGQRIGVGDPVGAVGSSGNSSEPHLHLQVTDDNGAGVPMLLPGRRRPLQRNDVLRPGRRRGVVPWLSPVRRPPPAGGRPGPPTRRGR